MTISHKQECKKATNFELQKPHAFLLNEILNTIIKIPTRNNDPNNLPATKSKKLLPHCVMIVRELCD
jgi:hypothetical protein